MADIKTIGIVVRNGAPAAQALSARLLEDLKARGIQVIFSKASARTLNIEGPSLPLNRLGEQCDLVIAMGGDGTLLGAGRAVAPLGVPLLGVNLGRLGFMVDIAPENASDSLSQILEGDCLIEHRLILEAWETDADAPAPVQIAINDVVVRHRRYVHMLDFTTYANDVFISQHRADGIIVSTPTGSTAYALSSGGPMIQPEVDAIALVPISPHNLSDRPLIVPARTRLKICISNQEDNPALFTCDGQVDTDLEPGASLTIRESDHKLKLLHPPDYDYFGILRDKLSWGSNRKRS